MYHVTTTIERAAFLDYGVIIAKHAFPLVLFFCFKFMLLGLDTLLEDVQRNAARTSIQATLLKNIFYVGKEIIMNFNLNC